MTRCVSLWQPWAELMRRELKLNETRSWATAPGPLAIQAAKKKFDARDYSPQFVDQLRRDGIDFAKLDYGCVLCIVDVLACRKTETIRDQISERERMYGNYDDGRYAWQTKMLRVFKEPVPLIGHQGLFGWWEGDKYLAGAAVPPVPQFGPLFGGVQ
jgi:hypothetical protein